LASHAKAARAQDEGRFDAEIFSATNPQGVKVEADEGVRRGGTLDGMGGLRPAFRPDGVITAGNASQISDGASGLLVTTSEKAAELGLTPIARVHTSVVVGDDPIIMLTGPIPATRKLLDRNGMTVDDIDLFEANEAFSSVVLAWERELKPDMDRVNVNGGAIALGHAVGATGARLMATALAELERRDAEFGLVTMCCGGGLGTATLIQRLAP
jgi:acetyl-CoA acyltransferase